ncbi:MAG: OmpH family outer membrane protein [Phascolarctobacterium sp.]|nr:OmpH family outer membrane protein [Phascolarctobacterium sp.]
MRKHIFMLVLTIIMTFGICAAVSAADDTLIGYVNVQQVFRSYPDFASANSAVDLERQKAQQEFESKYQSLDEKGRQELGEKLSERIAKRERELIEPIQKKIRKAIEIVAKRNGITNVVDGSVMLFGGKDLTQEVIAEAAK